MTLKLPSLLAALLLSSQLCFGFGSEEKPSVMANLIITGTIVTGDTLQRILEDFVQTVQDWDTVQAERPSEEEEIKEEKAEDDTSDPLRIWIEKEIQEILELARSKDPKKRSLSEKKAEMLLNKSPQLEPKEFVEMVNLMVNLIKDDNLSVNITAKSALVSLLTYNTESLAPAKSIIIDWLLSKALNELKSDEVVVVREVATWALEERSKNS